MPRLETISVHKPALGAARVVADDFDGVGNIKDVLTLSPSQTHKIFWSGASDLVKMIFLKILGDLLQVIVVNLNLS